MRLAPLGVIAIVACAAAVSIGAEVHPFRPLQFAASAILVLAATAQRLNVVQRWISGPRDKRKQNIEMLAQQAFLDICSNRIVTEELLGLTIHVWGVPVWYRRFLPYALRRTLKSITRRLQPSLLARWTIRPALGRAAVVGLSTKAPSGIRFRKGYGLIGVCLADNDGLVLLTLDVSAPEYNKALRATRHEWAELDPVITHNLSLADSQKLAQSYGQVIAKVTQDVSSGEAIGCVTVSLKTSRRAAALKLDEDTTVRRALTVLSHALAEVL